MQKLLKKAGHLFIYAATIYRFLLEFCDPDSQILQMLSSTSESDLSTKDLDEMYNVIVQAAAVRGDRGDRIAGYFRAIVRPIILL